MRSDKEMMELILGFAYSDARVRAAAMNGSRTNPNVPRDRFQDYDIVYLVSEMDSFLQNPGWVDMFGDRIIMQTPESGTLIPPDNKGRFAYLMLFTDGNRLDLTLIPVEQRDAYITEDKLTVILLDKDALLPELPPPSDEDYRVTPPSSSHYADCCNEFWWVSTYVAKGLWRNEHLYAYDHLNQYVRPMLLLMLNWQAGLDTEFKVSTGKNNKYLQRYLDDQTWQELLSTCSDASIDGMWRALFALTDLFRRVSSSVAERMGFHYAAEEDQRVTAYLLSVYNMKQTKGAST